MILDKSKSDLQNKRCFICGEYDSESKDHIPPKSIFLNDIRTKGNDLISVPAHSSCNINYSKDDEYFRLFIDVPGFWKDKNAQELWNTKIFNSFQRPEARSFKQNVISSLEPVDLFTESGIFLGKSAKMKFDSDRIIRVVERIARGIYYKETKSIMPLNNICESILLKPKVPESFDILNNLSLPTSFADGTFIYRWSLATDNPLSGLFWFKFFDAVDFVVFFFPKIEWDVRST